MQPLLKGQVELVFIDGPLKAEADNPMRASQEQFFKGMEFFDFARWVKDPEAEAEAKSFWSDLAQKFPNSDDQVAYLEKHPDLHLKNNVLRQYEDLDEALEYLQEQLHKHRPIDGVLGFSQGANMASLLAAQAEAGHGADLSFVVHICPGRPGWVQQRPRLFRKPLPIRSLHISGRKDQNPPFALKHLYEKPACFMHNDGHRPVPGTTPHEANFVARTLIDFLLGRTLELPPEKAERSAEPEGGEPEPSATVRMAEKELEVVVNVNRELGITYEMTVPGGTTVFGLKEMLSWQDPTETLRPDHFVLCLPGVEDGLSDTQMLTTFSTDLDLRELESA